MHQDISEDTTRTTLSVADFIERVNASLLSHTGRIKGEVTSISKNYPTAIYFSIKDTENDALLNCIIWRSAYNQNGIDLEVGDEIIVTGTPEIYARNGRFSLKTTTIEYAGEGALKKAYEELRDKLTKEGLFDKSKKRSLPVYPEKIGVITSKVGVVMQDFSSNIGRYGFKVTSVDSRVEGKDAIHDILASIKTMAKQDIEVLVIMRGGGSWESLQPFNTESVVRAIAGFKCPVLTGIGHDVDVTLSELAADVGESTPTAVAEALNETWDTLASSLDHAHTKIFGSYNRHILGMQSDIDSRQSKILNFYQRKLSSALQTLSEGSNRIHAQFRLLERRINRVRESVHNVFGTMKASLRERSRRISNAADRMKKSMAISIASVSERVASDVEAILLKQSETVRRSNEVIVSMEKQVNLADPERNLRLGYSLSYSGGKLVRSVKQLKEGSITQTKLADGEFTSEIKSIK